MNSATFSERLYNMYGGEVIAIERYQNSKSTIRFHCGKCQTVFFNRPDYLLDKPISQHLCGHDYKATSGVRHKVNGPVSSERIRVKLLKRQQKEIRVLVESGISIYYIAMQTDLNVSTIRYFIQGELKEGLSR